VTARAKPRWTLILALDGPPWYPVFTRYHAGAMALALGDKAAARAYFTDLLTDPQGGGAAPDTYIRNVMALASMEARDGNKRAALDALAAGEDFSPNYAPLAALRQLIEADGKPQAGVKTAQQGAAAALFHAGRGPQPRGRGRNGRRLPAVRTYADPDDAATLVILGGLKERMGKMEDAIALYEMVPENLADAACFGAAAGACAG
jgi:tetratricopeptide (TPR) repeat protein